MAGIAKGSISVLVLFLSLCVLIMLYASQGCEGRSKDLGMTDFYRWPCWYQFRYCSLTLEEVAPALGHCICWYFFFRTCFTFFRSWSDYAFGYFDWYRKLEVWEKDYWSASIVSSLLSCIVVSFVTQVFFFSKEGFKPWITDWKRIDPTLIGLCPLFIGYIVSDMIPTTWRHRKKWTGFRAIMIHHLLAVVAFFQTLYFGYGLGYAAFGLMMETTTPFVNLRWHLAKAKVSKANPLFVLNGILLVILWVALRNRLYK